MPSERGKFVRISVDLEQREYDRLRQAAERRGCPKVQIVRETLNRRLKDVETETATPDEK